MPRILAPTSTRIWRALRSEAEALTWGPVNSMSVVQGIGAQKGLLTREALLSYLEKAPHYKPLPL